MNAAFDANRMLKESYFELGTIFVLLFIFPQSLVLKKDTFLSLMQTNLIPDSYSLVMDSCSAHYLLVSIFFHWLELSLKKGVQ